MTPPPDLLTLPLQDGLTAFTDIASIHLCDFLYLCDSVLHGKCSPARQCSPIRQCVPVCQASTRVAKLTCVTVMGEPAAAERVCMGAVWGTVVSDTLATMGARV